ncbi:hypothetical protein [Aliiruegeria sabulilitoris]|uniref:hypothetical protein n=1 Tax=Aliiruegeria sabulilitoris TaxID=1510458 RepID=UPI000829ECCF|nr:hypothetical protein [Aliiruegeria sabulilitoris]NDR58707.1 hypothetical protein [Pseudoruegeria sp. M32A2M]
MAPMNTEAFKDCDIRGTYPDQVNEDIFARVGREYARLLADGPNADGDTLVIGGDGRISTPDLLAATIRGLSTAPIGIVELGARVPTPAIYWAKHHFGAQASAICTASHNPPQWNGLKVMNGELPPTPNDINFLADKASESAEVAANGLARIRKVENIVGAYMDAMMATFAGQSLEGLKVVVDPGNGCMSGVASRVLADLGAEVTALHDRIDGNFSERNPDCAIPESLATLVRTVLDTGADFGVGFDGDGDRIAIVDDKGRILGSERLAIVLFKGAIPCGEGDNVILDIKCSMHLERAIAALGGTPRRCKSGHAYMKRMVLEHDAIAGVELSGHVFLGEIHGRDDPLHTAIRLAGWLVAQDRKLSAFVDKLPAMFMTEDIRIAMDAAAIDALLASCAAGLEGAEVQKIDGVRLVWPSGWLLVRRSITEPKVTIRLEGEGAEDLRRIGRLFGESFPQLEKDVAAALGKFENT